ncbi:MAG: alpha/beta hydrolase [Gammaproteobacteria bacterium]
MTEHPLLAAHSSTAPVRGGVRGRLVNFILRRYFKRRLQHIEFNAASIADMRKRMEVVARRAGRRGRGLKIEQRTMAGVPVEILAPTGASDQLPVVVYFHGGAFVAGSPSTHRSLTASLAADLPARVIVVDYRLAPEHPFPAALDDVTAVFHALLDEVPAGRIAFAGDSAGGNLVLTTMLRARDAGVALPAAAVALSPWTDLTGSGASVQDNAQHDAMLPGDKIELAARLYAPQDDLRNPLLSPVFADLGGLPPLLLHVGTTEILRDDATRVLIGARDAGVDATLRLWQDLPHVFHIFGRQLPAARLAQAELANFLRARLNAS